MEKRHIGPYSEEDSEDDVNVKAAKTADKNEESSNDSLVKSDRRNGYWHVYSRNILGV